jgi:hypothetical protein
VISTIPASTRGKVLKACVNLAKYLNRYEEFQGKLKNAGIKWLNSDDAFNSFLRVVNNNHRDLSAWYKNAQGIRRDNEKLYLGFVLVTGLRKEEGIMSSNRIIELSKEGRLYEYYNADLGILTF